MEDINFNKKFRFIWGSEVIEFTCFSSGYLLKELQQSFKAIADELNKDHNGKKLPFFIRNMQKIKNFYYSPLFKNLIEIEDLERVVLEIETDIEDRTIVNVKNMEDSEANRKWFRKSVRQFYRLQSLKLYMPLPRIRTLRKPYIPVIGTLVEDESKK